MNRTEPFVQLPLNRKSLLEAPKSSFSEKKSYQRQTVFPASLLPPPHLTMLLPVLPLLLVTRLGRTVLLLSPIIPTLLASWANRERWLSAVCQAGLPSDVHEQFGIVPFNNFRFFAEDLILTVAQTAPAEARPAFWEAVGGRFEGEEGGRREDHVVLSESSPNHGEGGHGERRTADLSFVQLDAETQQGEQGRAETDRTKAKRPYFDESGGGLVSGGTTGAGDAFANVFGENDRGAPSPGGRYRSPENINDEFTRRDAMRFPAGFAQKPKKTRDDYFAVNGGADAPRARSGGTPDGDQNSANRLDALSLDPESLPSFFNRAAPPERVAPPRADGDDVARRPGYDTLMHGSRNEQEAVDPAKRIMEDVDGYGDAVSGTAMRKALGVVEGAVGENEGVGGAGENEGVGGAPVAENEGYTTALAEEDRKQSASADSGKGAGGGPRTPDPGGSLTGQAMGGERVDMRGALVTMQGRTAWTTCHSGTQLGLAMGQQ